MKSIFRKSFFILLPLIFLVSCSETRKKATEHLDDLNQKTEELNSAVDEGFKKLESLDSVVQEGTRQIRKVDSLVTKSTSKVDSIAKEKAKAWEELTTF